MEMHERTIVAAFAERPLQFLRTLCAHRVPHTEGTLIDHLLGTAAVLKRWGYPEDICLAGLFHSVYGTSTFETSLLSLNERDRVTQIIGESAERTAFFFSQMDQEEFWKQLGSDEPHLRLRHQDVPVRVDPNEMQRLMAIFWANEIEQASRTMLRLEPTKFRTLVKAVQPFLPDQVSRDISKTWEGASEVKSVDQFAGKLFVFDSFYEDIERIYEFSKVCSKRAYKLGQFQGMESVLGYPSQAMLRKIRKVLGVREVVDKTDEQCLFGLFRYMMAEDASAGLGVHVDVQPWTLIVYISPTVDAPATGIYRHSGTQICDIGTLEPEERESFVKGPLDRDRNDADAWECVYATKFRQNSALLFKAGDLLHTRVMTWGNDVKSARVTQNFNFQVR